MLNKASNFGAEINRMGAIPLAVFTALVFCLACSLPFALNNVVDLGHNIPQADLIPDYTTGVFWAISLAFVLVLAPIKTDHKKPLLILWLLKSFVTLVVMLFYEDFYPFLDSYAYFEAANPENPLPGNLGLGWGTENVTALAWIHSHILPHSFHALKVTFSFIGLFAIYFFYLASSVFLGRDDIRVLFLIGLFPSVLFWSSILGKDPISLFAIGVYVLGTIRYYVNRSTGALAYVLCGIGLGVMIRSWLGLILLLPLAIMFMTGLSSVFTRIVLSIGTLAASALVVSQMGSQFSFDSLSGMLETADSWSKSWAVGGSAQELQVEIRSVGSLVQFLPLGIFTALFRPLPGEVLNPFGLMAGLENAILLLLLFVAVARTRLGDFRDPIVVWAIALIMTWSTLYSVISYQNLGTAVRFKLQILPVLLLTLAYLARRRSSNAETHPTQVTRDTPDVEENQ